MSTKLQAMLRVSVEGLEETQVPADLPTAQEDAEAVAEVQQAEQAVENADQQLETLEQVSQSLEALAVALEANPHGLDSAAARMLHITVESQLARVGENVKVLPALECFQPQSTQLATTLSMEGLVETTARIWEKVCEALVKFARHIGALLKQMLSRTEQHRIRVVKARADLANRQTAPSKGTVNFHERHRLLTEGEWNPALFERQLSELQQLLDARQKLALQMPGHINSLLEMFTSDPNSTHFETAAKDLIKQFKAGFANQTTDRHLITYKTNVLPGDVVFTVYHTPVTEVHLRTLTGSMGVKRESLRSGAAEESDALKTLDPVALEKIEGWVTKFSEQLDHEARELNAVQGQLESLYTRGYKLIIKASGLHGESRQSADLSSLRILGQNHLRLVFMISSYTYGLVTAMASYAEQSVRDYPLKTA